MAQVHKEKLQMPAVLREEPHEAWLSGSTAEAKDALAPYPSELMVAWQVGRNVNNVKGPNNPSLIEPVRF
jgi:putative SOS response-associated peptidase YedK